MGRAVCAWWLRLAAIALLGASSGVRAFVPGGGGARASVRRQLPPLMAPRRAQKQVEEPLSPNPKLVYDAKTGRFFEKEIEQICRDEYCAVDEKTGQQVLLTKAEKERIFLDCIQSYYYSGRQLLNDDDFDKLRSDLAWEGSDVVLLSKQEVLFLNAMGAYLKGTPIISDAEFDALKTELKDSGSMVAVSTEPKCYIDTGICSVTFTEDKYREATLYVPAGVPLLFFFTGLLYEIIEPFKDVNPLFILIMALFPAWATAKVFTENVFATDNPKIASGPCPSCGFTNRIFFGTVLGVPGPQDEASMKCPSCKEEITIRKRDLRARTFSKTS